ncbi:restriction endonuclease subunit S [Myroides phaeus]|uniref:restriction endonuclease subunit S n=1 Tax=Myroides phaeus TaxID=702745 RepID=UPI002DB629EA|nr:restriction endonuclease subunit S [Myroides phaeus]MEC4116021.1 restriction endonuclease subunit S [Myroides phaeus]
MNNDNTLIPNYRFPEFKNDGSWNKLKVEEIIMNESSSLSINKLEFLDNGYKLFGADGLVGYIDSYKQKDDYIAIVKDGSGAGRLSYYPAYSSVVGTLTYLKIKDKKLNDLKFQYYNLHNIDFKNHIKGGGIPHIYYSDYKNDLIGNPTNPSEQQKIAACLSSLDDVIAGHEEKLTLLEEHKKGLMQNLFPQEGETQPKYRFPEFENDGDWDVVPFSKYITLFRGSSPRPIVDFQTTDEDAVNWIKIGDTKNAISYKLQYAEEKITHEGAKKSRPVVNGEIILANSMSYGKAYILELDGCIYDGWFVLRNYEAFFDKNYLIQLLNSDYLQNQYKKLAAGGIVQNISSEIVYNTELFHTTKEEQQKIASVLSSVDELIVAQREKIEALKEHKKGLMQGLFPKIES